MARQYQIPGPRAKFVNETSTRQYQHPAGAFVNETVAAAATFQSAWAVVANVVVSEGARTA